MKKAIFILQIEGFALLLGEYIYDYLFDNINLTNTFMFRGSLIQSIFILYVILILYGKNTMSKQLNDRIINFYKSYWLLVYTYLIITSYILQIWSTDSYYGEFLQSIANAFNFIISLIVIFCIDWRKVKEI